jgi:dipeptide/tripeptide permease
MTTVLFKKGMVFFIIICVVSNVYILLTIGISKDNISHLLKQIEGHKDGDFDNKISLYMRIGHMPSLSTCIIKNNSIVWYGGYGLEWHEVERQVVLPDDWQRTLKDF